MNKIKIYLNEDALDTEFDKTNELIRQLVDVQHTLKKIEYGVKHGKKLKHYMGDLDRAYDVIEQTKESLHQDYIEKLQ